MSLEVVERNRFALSKYVDLRLGLVDGRLHTPESAWSVVADEFGDESASYARRVCSED